MKRKFLLAIVCVGIISGGVLFCWPLLPTKANEARNESADDLRGLHAAAAKYVTDQGHWPQMPDGLTEGDEKDFFAFWKKALSPYGATDKMWKNSADQSKGKSSYIPTAFDAQPFTAYRWNHPWFIARGDLGDGSIYVVLPDGSVTTTEQLEKEEKAKTEAKKAK